MCRTNQTMKYSNSLTMNTSDHTANPGLSHSGQGAGELPRRAAECAPYHRIGLRISSPLLAVCVVTLCALMFAWGSAASPVKIIFDTDVGNDVDDVLALSVLHSLQSRGECELLAVTITKPDELAGPFVDALNTFYGRPKIPLGSRTRG